MGFMGVKCTRGHKNVVNKGHGNGDRFHQRVTREKPGWGPNPEDDPHGDIHP